MSLSTALTQSPQSWLETPEDHALWLHGGGIGDATVARKLPSGEWWQRSYSVTQLRNKVSQMAGETNAYISQNRFIGTRSASRLVALQANYVDLDCYKISRLADLPVELIADWVLMTLEDAKRPRPTLVVASGRGLYLLWRYPPIPATAEPRWLACQEELVRTLTPFGADPACKDTARVLRLIGSVHQQTRAVVRQLLPLGPEWTFDLFADELLPMTRAEVHDLQARRAEKKARSRARPAPVPRKQFTLESNYTAKYTDIRRMISVRYGGLLPEGDRYRWIKAGAICLAWICNPYTLECEIVRFAGEVAGWPPKRTMQKMSTIIKQAKDAYDGKKVIWNGEERDPRVAYGLKRMIRDLDVTPELQAGNLILIDSDERKKRKNAAERERKVLNGETKMDRATYLAKSLNRTKPWETLNISKSTYYRKKRAGELKYAQGTPPHNATDLSH